MLQRITSTTFAKYTLAQFGYNINDIDKIIQIISDNYSNEIYKYEPSFPHLKIDEIDYYLLKSENDKIKFNAKYDIILKEFELKNNLGLIDIENINYNKLISATDLAAFIFCSASYSINKTFNIEKYVKFNNLINGSELHKRSNVTEDLKNIFSKGKFKNNIQDIDFKSTKYPQNKYIIYEIINSEILFEDKNENEFYFINEEANFIGKPDYIAKNKKNEIYVIESTYFHKIIL